MLRVMVRQARPGMRLARAVHNPRQPDTVLLTRGFELTAALIARLHEVGIYDLWVNYPGLDFLDDYFSPELSAQQQRLCETLRLGFSAQVERTVTSLPIAQYRDVVEELVKTLVGQTAALTFMSELAGADDVLLRHSAELCYLGVMLGLKLEGYLATQRKRLGGGHAREVVNLGIGCMLHDLGELQLPEGQRESRRRADDPDEHWRMHAELGYARIHGQVEASAATVVLNHHQHFDGSGFPAAGGHQAQSGTQIHVYSRIAMAADTLQHFLRRDGMPMPTLYALWKIQQKPYADWFDPVVMAALLEVVPPFLPGMVVGLNDGRLAVVTRNQEGTPCYPEVQVLGEATEEEVDIMSGPREVVDLRQAEGLRIETVDGYGVTEWLYGPRVGKTPRNAIPKEPVLLGV